MSKGSKIDHIPLFSRVYVAHNSKILIGEVHDVKAHIKDQGYEIRYRVLLEVNGQQILKSKSEDDVYDSLDMLVTKVGEL